MISTERLVPKVVHEVTSEGLHLIKLVKMASRAANGHANMVLSVAAFPGVPSGAAARQMGQGPFGCDGYRGLPRLVRPTIEGRTEFKQTAAYLPLLRDRFCQARARKITVVKAI